MSPPRIDNATASMRNCDKISRLRAPTASLRPISFVRSVTDTNMIFMMPIPPTISDTAAVIASNCDKVSCVSLRERTISAMLRNLKSSSAPGFTLRRSRSKAPISSSTTPSGMVRSILRFIIRTSLGREPPPRMRCRARLSGVKITSS